MNRRTCIAVLGMHRSGTSALTRMLNILGAGLPRTLIGPSEGNDTGHWEPLRLVLLHDDMLKEAGSNWDDWRPFDPSRLGARRYDWYRGEAARIFREDFNDDELVVLKDPRICRFVPFIGEVCADCGLDMKAVLMTRDPLEVSASLERRNGMSRPQALLLYLRHMLDAEKETRSLHRAFIDYADLLADWRSVRDTIVAQTGAVLAAGDSAAGPTVDAFLSPDRRHHNAGDGHLGVAGEFGDWMETVAEQFRLLAIAGEQEGASRELDRVSMELEHATPFLAGIEAHYSKRYSSTVDARVSRGVRLAKTYLRPLGRRRPKP
ncbi:MAG: sulfotransferase family protein [Flavobacteriaceae bacterium]